MNKVQSQQLVPALPRNKAQGLAIAFTRLVIALFAFVTPVLLTANSSLSFGLLFAFAVGTAAIGLFWVPRLPKATELEPAEAVSAPLVGKPSLVVSLARLTPVARPVGPRGPVLRRAPAT